MRERCGKAKESLVRGLLGLSETTFPNSSGGRTLEMRPELTCVRGKKRHWRVVRVVGGGQTSQLHLRTRFFQRNSCQIRKFHLCITNPMIYLFLFLLLLK
jgi:hypothetical protein